jgi:CheY-like chemotaxis protein
MTTVLLVEDSATDMAMMQAILQRAACEVLTATNGREAIEQMQENPPDVVVTDLQMPVMDGEALVRHVVQHFPAIPVILATAHGSEVLAADALAHGAVNFVPKVSVGSLLPRVVQQACVVAQAACTFEGFTIPLQKPEFYFKLENRVEVIEPVIAFLGQVLSASASMSPTTRMRLGTAVASAIFNAICYGNLELTDEDARVRTWLAGNDADTDSLMAQPDGSTERDRIVRLKVSVGSRDTRISVAHEGPGLEQCRGWLLITSFLDEVLLNTDCSEVVMVKRHD